MRRKDEATARLELTEALKLSPPAALLLLGHLEMEEEHWSEAATACHRLLELDPGVYECHYQLANSLGWSGSFDESLEHLRRGQRLHHGATSGGGR